MHPLSGEVLPRDDEAACAGMPGEVNEGTGVRPQDEDESPADVGHEAHDY